MKKILSLILLPALLFVSSGYFLYFKYLQHLVRQEVTEEIREGVEEGDLTVIIVSEDNRKEIVWTRKAKEFRFHGSMYDVVRSKTLGSKIYYYCRNDTKEKELVSRMVRHQRRRNKTLLRLRKVFNNKYYPENFSITPDRRVTAVLFPACRHLYRSRYMDVASPPPRPFFQS